MTNGRYVVSIRTTGLGDRLACLGAAWRFARLTGRTLVADWRHGAYGAAGGGNQFARCFATDDLLSDVPFVGSYGSGRLALPTPRYPAAWNDDRLLAWPFLREAAMTFAERDAAVQLIRAGNDPAEPTVVFDTCVNDGLVSFDEAKAFLTSLRPVAPVTEAVEFFAAAHLRRVPVIGLHIRHGNGGLTGHAHYWVDFEAAVKRCVKAVAAARGELGHAAPVLLCTDSEAVERSLCAHLDGVIVRGKRYRPVGEGELHLGPDSAADRNDALVEMLLLAECQALIRFPPGSFFSFPAAVLKPSRRPAPSTVYELQVPWDGNDPLSPALLF